MVTQARAHKKELIQFIVGDEGSLALGLNFAFTLRNLGYDHWFAFGGEDDTICRKFMQAMPDGGGATLYAHLLLHLLHQLLYTCGKMCKQLSPQTSHTCCTCSIYLSIVHKTIHMSQCTTLELPTLLWNESLP